MLRFKTCFLRTKSHFLGVFGNLLTENNKIVHGVAWHRASRLDNLHQPANAVTCLCNAGLTVQRLGYILSNIVDCFCGLWVGTTMAPAKPSMTGEPMIDLPQKPMWCEFGNNAQDGIEKLLDFASTNYTRHMDWFLKHRDRALVELGALITAALTVVNYLDAEPKKLSPFLLITIYIVIMLLALVFGTAGIFNCRRSYQAGLESIALVNKAIWVMGFTGRITVAQCRESMAELAPLKGDPTFFTPRWTEMKETLTTKNLTDSFLGKGLSAFRPRENTCFFAMLVIGVLAAFSFMLGCVLAMKAAGFFK